MSPTDTAGYDVIGDVHGCATKLEALLTELGYRPDRGDGPYRHPVRQAIFVGDLIDNGGEQHRVLQVAKSMVDTGTARMVLGNHEFNALAYRTEHPPGSGKFLRPHGDPTDEWSEKNERQHEAFLLQIDEDARNYYLDWLWTQPLWLDLGDLRVVHACWHAESIATVRTGLGGDRFVEVDQLVRASAPDDPLYVAVETILKGPEISLIEHGHGAYRDKGGFSRDSARVRWWDDHASTLRDLAVMDSRYTTEDGDAYPLLPETEVHGLHRTYVYSDQIPVIYGHYWRKGDPEHREDWTDYTACVDFSAVKGGSLTAYRWSGEGRINPDNYVSVG